MTHLLKKANSELKEGLDKNDSVEAFKEFEDRLLSQLLDGRDMSKTMAYLNGAAASAVRELVSLDQRRKDGIFFTGHELAEKLVSYVAQHLADGASAFDPTCGAGDLLLAAAKAMKLSSEPVQIATQLSSRIKGFDLHRSFIESAKLRVLLMASLVHKGDRYSEKNLFPNLCVADSLTCQWNLDGKECLLLNPPFGQVVAPSETTWGGGRVQRSALFVDKSLKEMHVGQHAVAILPDVLRSGSNYAKWRKHVAQFANILAVESIGRFDSTTDVDVFLIHIQRSAKAGSWPDTCSDAGTPCIGDFFTVRTGPLVAYREPNLGPWRPFVDCANAVLGIELFSAKKRRFRGTVVSGPFVVIRRTSSPSDESRTIATIVNLVEPVAIENHLIIIQPIDGRIETCRDLMAYLQTDLPTIWLNSRIRCRHLTVTAVRSIPLNWRERDER